MNPSRSLLLTLVTLTWCVAPLRADNLVPNGSFEEEKDTKLPRGWRNLVDGVRNLEGMYVRGGTEGADTHTGTHSIKLRVSTTGGLAGTGRKPRNIWESSMSGEGDTTPPIPLYPGKTYRLSFWIKREGFSDPTHSVHAEMRGLPFPAAGDTYFPLGSTERFTGDCDWEKQEVLIPVPPESSAGELQIIFRMLFGDNLAEGVASPLAYIDDVELTEAN